MRYAKRSHAGALPDRGGGYAPFGGLWPSAEALVRIDAPNAALWLLAVDGEAAAAWTGSDGADFDRAMDVG